MFYNSAETRGRNTRGNNAENRHKGFYYWRNSPKETREMVSIGKGERDSACAERMGSLRMKTVLTIAGTDPDGGAGIQADLKTFAALGVYGTSVVTAIVAQNTVRVQGIHEVPASFVGKQIDAVMEDIGPRVWKTGMLATSDIVKVVAKKAKEHNITRLVVDPVMMSKTRYTLLEKGAVNVLIKLLIPLSFVVTPNIEEAERFVGFHISTIEDMRRAAAGIHKMGAKHVVIKGGHLPEVYDAIDVFCDGKRLREFVSPRIKTRNTHGTGCTFSASIAAQLAKGNDIDASVRHAKDYVTQILKASVRLRIGKGNGPLNHFRYF